MAAWRKSGILLPQRTWKHPLWVGYICPAGHERVNLGARWRWEFNATSRPLYLLGKTRYPFWEARWAPGPVWKGAENLALTGFRLSDRPTRSESLYRLRYPGPRYNTASTKKRHWTLPLTSLVDLWKPQQISLKPQLMSFHHIPTRTRDHFPNAFPIQNFVYITSLPKF
jgi:hypothetical protein